MKNDVIKKIVIAVLIVVAILVLLFIGREIAVRFFGFKMPSISRSTSTDTKKIEISFNAETQYKHIVSDKYVYFITTDRIVVFDNGGDKKTELPISVQNMIVKKAGNYLAIGDIGRNNIYIVQGAEIVKNIETAKPIKNLSVNTSGICVAVTEGELHKRDVIVYDKDGEELFVWTSGTKLVLDAVIANNNKNVIISSLDTQSKTFGTVLNFYNISKEEPVATQIYDEEVIASLSTFDNYVYCIGESKTLIHSVSGDQKGEILYNDKSLMSYEVNQNGIVMDFLHAVTDNKRYSMEIYTQGGRKIASYDHDYEAKYIDASSDYVVMDREGYVSVIDYNGREKQLLDPGVDLKDLCFIGKTKKMVGITSDGAYILNIR